MISTHLPNRSPVRIQQKFILVNDTLHSICLIFVTKHWIYCLLVAAHTSHTLIWIFTYAILSNRNLSQFGSPKKQNEINRLWKSRHMHSQSQSNVFSSKLNFNCVWFGVFFHKMMPIMRYLKIWTFTNSLDWRQRDTIYTFNWNILIIKNQSETGKHNIPYDRQTNEWHRVFDVNSVGPAFTLLTFTISRHGKGKSSDATYI